MCEDDRPSSLSLFISPITHWHLSLACFFSSRVAIYFTHSLVISSAGGGGSVRIWSLSHTACACLYLRSDFGLWWQLCWPCKSLLLLPLILPVILSSSCCCSATRVYHCFLGTFFAHFCLFRFCSHSRVITVRRCRHLTLDPRVQ